MNPPVTEADLHAYVDGQLAAERQREIEAYLAQRPDEVERIERWRAHKRELRALFDPVLDEALPARLMRAAEPRTPWHARRIAAGIALVCVSGGAAWVARGVVDAGIAPLVASADGLAGFARRAAVAHVVYSPDARRPVEVGADEEKQLVAWLSKRLGTAVHPPSLKGVGYELIGGRLLPGESGPVAQFMYQDAKGQRLTLYATREAAKANGGKAETAFRFGHDGPVNVFYWVDRDFGYALSGAADRQVLSRVAEQVYRQLAAENDRAR